MQEQSRKGADDNRRLTKSELEEDRFLEWLMETVEYVQQKWQLFAGIGVGIALAILGINYALETQEDKKQEATAMLGEVFILEGSGQADQAVQMAEQLVRNYAGTPAAGQGTLMLANRYFAQGRYDEAETLYQRYLSDYGQTDILVFGATSGLAACMEAKGQMQAAAAKYLEYATTYPQAGEAALALIEAARCYGQAGDSQQQKALLEQILRDYGDSAVVTRARQQLELL